MTLKASANRLCSPKESYCAMEQDVVQSKRDA